MSKKPDPQSRKPLQPGDVRGNMKSRPTGSKPTATPQGQKPPTNTSNPGQNNTKKI